MRRVIVLSIVIPLAACGKSGATAGAGSGGSSSPPPTKSTATLKATIDGAPVAMTHTYIKKLPAEDRYQLLITNKPRGCGELMDNVFNGIDGEARILVNLGVRYDADGTARPVVTDVFINGGGEVKPGAKAVVTGTAAAGKPTEVALDAVLTADGKTYELHGTAAAEGCGTDADSADGKPKAAHPSTATITVAGKQLPIGGAIVVGTEPLWAAGAQPSRAITLSTGPKDCSGTTPWATFLFEYARGFWHLRGQGLDATMQNDSMGGKDGQPELAGIAITPGSAGTSADGPTLQLTLAGKGTIGGYPVELAGTIEALDCAETK